MMFVYEKKFLGLTWRAVGCAILGVWVDWVEPKNITHGRFGYADWMGRFRRNSQTALSRANTLSNRFFFVCCTWGNKRANRASEHTWNSFNHLYSGTIEGLLKESFFIHATVKQQGIIPTWCPPMPLLRRTVSPFSVIKGPRTASQSRWCGCLAECGDRL